MKDTGQKRMVGSIVYPVGSQWMAAAVMVVVMVEMVMVVIVVVVVM